MPERDPPAWTSRRQWGAEAGRRPAAARRRRAAELQPGQPISRASCAGTTDAAHGRRARADAMRNVRADPTSGGCPGQLQRHCLHYGGSGARAGWAVELFHGRRAQTRSRNHMRTCSSLSGSVAEAFFRRSKYTMMTGSSQWVFDVCFSRRSGGPPGSSLVAPRVAWDRRGGRSGRPSATGTLSGSGRVPDTCGHRKCHHQSKHRRENASGLESPGHDAVGDRGDPFRDWPPASGMPRQNPEREHVVDLVRRRPAAKAVRPAATKFRGHETGPPPGPTMVSRRTLGRGVPNGRQTRATPG